LGSHFRLRSIHPSQHGIWPSYPRDFSVEYPAGYSLRRRFSNYPDLFWSDKKVSTGAEKCQPPDFRVCRISGRLSSFTDMQGKLVLKPASEIFISELPDRL